MRMLDEVKNKSLVRCWKLRSQKYHFVRKKTRHGFVMVQRVKASYKHAKKKVTKQRRAAEKRAAMGVHWNPRTKRARNAMVAAHRAAAAAGGQRTKRELAEVIASLNEKEREALLANEFVISAVEKI